METQIQLGMKPQWHPYLFLLFFATLFEYNIHRLLCILSNKKALESDNYQWVRENLKVFYLLVLLSVVGFIIVLFQAKKEVLLALAPIAMVTAFYSMPFTSNQNFLFRLREVPYLKIFLIALVWASSTIFLPIIQADYPFHNSHVSSMFLERFFFIFAITIPFDIRDIEIDKRAGLKTIPLLLREDKSLWIAYGCLLIFVFISFFHYKQLNKGYILYALSISAITTFLFLYVKKIRTLKYYHYGILDGTMLLQGLLVLIFYLL